MVKQHWSELYRKGEMKQAGFFSFSVSGPLRLSGLQKVGTAWLCPLLSQLELFWQF